MNNIEEYVYLKVPNIYKDIYNNIILKVASLGKNILDNCEIICVSEIRDVIDIWNTFQIAVEAYNLELYDKAEVLINYIRDNLNLPFYGEGNIVEGSFNVLIPDKFICTYHSILRYLSNIKLNNIQNNDNICDKQNKYFIKLLALFNSAIANYNIKRYKVSVFLIKYINLELKHIIEQTKFSGYINDEQHMISIIGCYNNPKFKINNKGHLSIKPITNNDFKLNEKGLLQVISIEEDDFDFF